jgi:glycerol-3-phosphate acyltransferase PlsY
VFILVFALSRYVSLGSMLAAGALFLSELAFTWQTTGTTQNCWPPPLP